MNGAVLPEFENAVSLLCSKKKVNILIRNSRALRRMNEFPYCPLIQLILLNCHSDLNMKQILCCACFSFV